MGRYYGMIDAPKVSEAALVSVGPRKEKIRGAAPYAGPPRPVGEWEK